LIAASNHIDKNQIKRHTIQHSNVKLERGYLLCPG